MEPKPPYLIALAAIASLLIGVVIGYSIAGLSTPQPDTNQPHSDTSTIPIAQVKDRVMDFVNYKLVKPGVKAQLKDMKEEDQFYRFNLTLEKDGNNVADVSVYTTKDGQYLILNLIKLPEVIEKQEEKPEETTTPTPSTTPQSQTQPDIENEPYKGDENAEIVIVDFSSYSCPYCRKFTINTLPKILENFNVRYVFKDFPIHGEIAIKAHEAANCAYEQGKYWEYHDILFERQSEWMRNESKFVEYAKILGLNVEEFKACLDSGKYRDEILKDKEEGMDLGVRGTPTLFINGRKVVGAQPYEEFERIIRDIQSQR